MGKIKKSVISNKINHLNIYFPFAYSDKLDPRNVFTVGDQVLVEHIFAYHSRESIKEGFLPVFSNVQFDKDREQITLAPKYPIKRSDGSTFSFSSLCSSVKMSMNGTLHAPYASLLESIECLNQENKIILKFKKIPANIKELFVAPDYSIFDTDKIPFDKDHLYPSSGAYFLKRLDTKKAELEINPYYPQELRANNINSITIENFNPNLVKEFIKNADPSKEHLFYLMGENIDEEMLQTLKEKKYNIQQFPSETMLYLGINKRVSHEDRILIASKIDEWRDELLALNTFGQKAYSLSPSDRPFGLTSSEYKPTHVKMNYQKLKKNLVIGIWKNTDQMTFTKRILEKLQSEFPDSEIKLYSFKDGQKPEDADIYITSIGMSPADPLTHLSFLSSIDDNFNQIVKREEIEALATESDFNKFTDSVKAIEKRNMEAKVLIPIGHFPGIVVESPLLERDDSLAWGWGIQAWTYKIR